MRIRFIAGCAVLACACVGACREAAAVEWKRLDGDHFIVFYAGEEKLARDVSHKAEYYYEHIAEDLGYPRYSEFWTWDKRVKIYIYPDKASFTKSTSQPEWSEGMADYAKKQIVSYAWSQGFQDALLPHEMAHLIFRDFVGFKGEIPLWLDEGVAQWAEEFKRDSIKQIVKRAYQEDAMISLDDMMKLDVRKVSNQNKLFVRLNRTREGEEGVLFLDGERLVNIYYMQSVALVGFLIERYGSDRFAELCRQLRDGKVIEEALRFAYPSKIGSLPELETEWRKYIEGL